VDRNVIVFTLAHLTEFVLVCENLPTALRVIKSVDTGSADPVPLDHAITYTLVISNAGPGIAFGVVMTDPLPAALSAVGWVTGSVLLPPPTRVITWGPWDIPARKAYSVIFTATVTDAAYAGQTITNTAYVSAANHAPGASNSVTFTVASGVANTPPAISPIQDQSTEVDTPISVTFTISDAETIPDSLALHKASDNTGLVPKANIVFGGSGINRIATITPATGMTGTAIITITVSDGELSAREGFALDVKAKPAIDYSIYLPIIMRQ
jgi:uncharacterized repeat protein (TIGR01451 family)